MKYRKITALILATAMATGSSMAAFAADANSADGTGTMIPHLNREITAVTLPTDTAVATVFNYYVDPEQLIKDAGQLTDGSAVTGNENGVYFTNAGTAAVNGTVASTIAADTNSDYIVTVSDLTKNAEYKYDGTKWQIKKEDGTYDDTTVTIDVKENDNSTSGTLAANDTVTVSGAVAAGSASFSNSSDAVKFEGKNSVDVDVTVTATLDTTGDHSKDIALVADEDALNAASAPALLMTLKVGDNTKAITSAGATAKSKIAGVPDNFEVTVDNGNYKYAPKANVNAETWKSTTVQLIGKTNKKDVPAGMTVPKITLTWSMTKADAVAFGSWGDDGLWLAKDVNTGFSTTGLMVEVSDGGTTYTSLASDKYTVNDDGWVKITWDDIVAGIGGTTPTGTIYVRITDGSTKYVFENK